MRRAAELFIGSAACDTDLVIGRPSDSIAALAATRRAGLIVMGVTGADGKAGARPGSIAYQVLCQAGAPVLVVPPG